MLGGLLQPNLLAPFRPAFRPSGVLIIQPANVMRNATRRIGCFIRSDDWPTAVEYAVMLAMIVVVCLAAIKSVGTNAKTTFNNVANSIGS
jgi:pilus assembly protein Flp/PilA